MTLTDLAIARVGAARFVAVEPVRQYDPNATPLPGRRLLIRRWRLRWRLRLHWGMRGMAELWRSQVHGLDHGRRRR